VNEVRNGLTCYDLLGVLKERYNFQIFKATRIFLLLCTMFGEDVHLEDVLLVVALGHDLVGSKSVLKILPREIIHSILSREIERCYWDSRRSIGLLTPPEMNVTLRYNKNCAKLTLQALGIQRAAIFPVVKSSNAPKENLVSSSSKPIAFKDLTAPSMSRFITNRYSFLLTEVEDDEIRCLTHGSLSDGFDGLESNQRTNRPSRQ
jgi:hypothetical protein